MKKEVLFLEKVEECIKSSDAIHYKKIKSNLEFLRENYFEEFDDLLSLVYNYFNEIGKAPQALAIDYLKMIGDMRKEGRYFYKYGKYRCVNQAAANENVYSNKDVMSYYMNALLISQILWKHHFNIFMFFKKEIKNIFNFSESLSILDVGPGHGFFSFFVKKEFPNYKKIDIVDISEASLQMTERIIGHDEKKINYYHKDIFDYDDSAKYDFIVLGEVIEHLDDPKSILMKLADLLNENGVIWVTTPTNSPALDHVYLFHTKEDVLKLLEESKLKPYKIFSSFAEDVNEEKALEMRATNLVGVFCKI